jgi:predicted PurR-regulated permease PerM
MSSSVHLPVSGSRWLSPSFFLWHTLVPVVLAYILVAMPLLIGWMAGLLWFVLLMTTVRRYERRAQPRGALCAAALEVVIVVAIVAMAVAAPGKTRDKVLDRPVKLPKAEMTLAEIKELAEEGPRRESFPIHLSVRLQEADAATNVLFAREEMSLQEFVAAVESQTPIRHRFHSCGNGYTILEGEDCSFGMSLRRP